jgi:molybdopterin/thiamine biosynthesis adenylyltransferase
LQENEEERYSRQILLPQIGSKGQQQLLKSAVLVVGAGALGSVIAEVLVRSGVGSVRIVDRDIVEPSNLHRQILYDERDAALRLPKAEAAERKLKQINSTVRVEGVATNLLPRNVELLMNNVDLVLDGTDNLETRYVINDACVKNGVPWVYGGAVGTAGMLMGVVPDKGPCLRCLFPEPPSPGVLPTCETSGVLGTAPLVIGGLQATEAIKLLTGDTSTAGRLVRVDVWHKEPYFSADIPRDENCPCCSKKKFEFLSGQKTAWVTSLCGRNAVQVTPPDGKTIDIKQLQHKLAAVGDVHYNGFTLNFQVEGFEFIVFPDGRVMVKGTTEKEKAMTLIARYIG